VPVHGGQPVRLVFWTQTNQLKVYQHLVDGYRRIHPNVEVTLVAASYQDHFAKLRTALASGVGPDLFHMHNEFAEVLRPYMAPYPAVTFPRSALEADFLQVDSHVVNERLYFLDTGLMTSAIYYDKKVWAAAGLTKKDIPRTWDQLRTLAERLTVVGPDGKIERSGFDPNGIGTALLLALNLQQGQRLFEAREGRQALVDTPATRRSLAYLQSLYTTHRVADVELPPFHEALGSGRAALIYAWGWAEGWLAEQFPARSVGMFPIPTWDGRVPPAYDRSNGECSMGVNAASPAARQEAAFDLIRYFLADDTYLAEFCQTLSLIPSKRNLLAGSAFAGPGRLERTVWPGPLPDFYEKTLDDELVDPVLVDHRPVDRALAETQASLDRQFEGSGFRSREDQYTFAADFRP